MEINNLLTLENISLASTGLINLILFIVIGLRNNKNKNSYFFLGFILSVFGWVTGVLFFRVLDNYKYLFLVTEFVYFWAIFIPLFIILFTRSFPRRNLDYSILQRLFLLAPPFIFAVLTLIPGAIIKNVTLADQYRSIEFGHAYPFYVVYIITYFSIGLVMMLKKYLNLGKGLERDQIEITFLSILFSALAGVATNLIMPTFGNFSLFWVGPFYSGYMVLTITYAIVRYGLFDIKLIATEFVTLTTWIIMFGKIFFSRSSTDRIVDIIVFVLLLISGIYVIRSVIKEKALREKDDLLVDNVNHLNKTLEKSNLKLKELDQKKSEFMSLATHQLRAPLTAMRGYSSMILDGTFGEVKNPEVEDAIDKISRSTTDLVTIVEDYLNISRIEQGRMQYNFSTLNISDLLNRIIKEVHVTVERAGLYLNFHDDGTEYQVHVDEGKIKQVLFNIIDNAIKYTPKGGIDVYVSKTEKNTVLVKVQDTGVGIKPEVLPMLFNKFTRAPDASKTNILGTGLGLYVANEILKAHNGRAWAESDGEGKGSRFFVEIGLTG